MTGLVTLAFGLLVGSTAVGDGYLDDADVCGRTPDVAVQTPLLRPYGGVVHAPTSLSPDQRAAVGEAVRGRYELTGGQAIWRVVYEDAPVPLGADVVRLVSCAPSDVAPGGDWAWAFPAPTAGIGFVWEGFSPVGGWKFGVAASLRALEGRS